jgi:hypothetical protein
MLKTMVTPPKLAGIVVSSPKARASRLATTEVVQRGAR